MNVDKLRRLLAKTEDFLRRHADNDWAARIRDISSTVEQSAPRSAVREQVRQLFGGMGSFTDLWISRANGHAVQHERKANEELEALRQELWKVCNE